MTALNAIVGEPVSPEVEQDLRTFAELVIKWNRQINLISRSTEAEIWDRHILDSAQTWPLAPQSCALWVDIGSGGGFPGIVVAILAKALRPEMQIVLIEADKRKAAFLMQASRALKLNCDIRAVRAESVTNLQANVVSARALAPLSDLLKAAKQIAYPDAVMIFPKGERAEEEIAAARQSWQFALTQVQSVTHPAASLLRITDLTHD